jgi:asparagine synthase (glutamine-hydrolysing)
MWRFLHGRHFGKTLPAGHEFARHRNGIGGLGRSPDAPAGLDWAIRSAAGLRHSPRVSAKHVCGIGAILRQDGAPVLEAELRAMSELLQHRGPDGCGHFADGPLGLAHRRLKVIDLEGGYQPMADARGRARITFNGEVYNYRKLARELESNGVRLRTRSDTETILGAYELFGDSFVDHLHGMFAFVLWDSANRRLIAVRDRLGIKPLYVFRSGALLAFASEIKAFEPLREWQPRLRSEAVRDYLTFRSLPGTSTLFEGVERVAPGEMWIAEGGALRTRRYWHLPMGEPEGSDRSSSEWAQELDSLLREVVIDHLVSDVPVGTFNSGGVDSSLVTALVSERAGSHLNTFSVGFEDPAFDESPHAQVVADRFATHHRTLFVEPRDYARSLGRAIWHHDEPLNHPHSIHLMKLCRLAKKSVTVVLTGEGSDELFAGYTRYRLLELLDRLPRWMRSGLPVLRCLAGVLPSRQRLRTRGVLRPGGVVDIGRLTAFVDPGQVATLLRPGLSGETDATIQQGEWGRCLDSALRHDQSTYLQSLLNRMDKMSMAHGLEGRVPFCDHRIVELAARIPASQKLRYGKTKVHVKAVARRYLPEEIVERGKAGFSVPLTSWLRPGGVLADQAQLLLDPRSLERGILMPELVGRVVDEHVRGRRDHGELLWGLVNLEVWHRLFVDRDRVGLGL